MAASSAIAEFFAKKKRKKPFKFNANLVDANTIASTTHVDAPALSTQESKAPTGAAETNAPASAANVAGQQASSSSSSSPDWDDAAHHQNSNKTAAPKIAMEQTTLEMKTTAGAASDNIAQRMRIEETKAQLAAARQGMEREAQKLAQEKARQQAVAAEKAQAVAASGRWVAPHMRASPQLLQASRLPGAKLDTASEELFPDLAAAGKILQEKGKSQTIVRVPKKTPVGGGATWASKPKISKTTTTTTTTAPTPEPPAAPTPKKERKQQEKETAPPLSLAPEPVVETPAPVPVTPLPTVPPKITRKTGTKKKKKDLSTFKPGGAS